MDPAGVKHNAWPGQSREMRSLWTRGMLKLSDVNCSRPVGKTVRRKFGNTRRCSMYM